MQAYTYFWWKSFCISAKSRTLAWFLQALKGSIINNVLNARTRQNYKINIEEEMKSSYIDYSMSVIVARALPDVRDGFKPVHRRILYGMMELGNTSDKPYKKQPES